MQGRKGQRGPKNQRTFVFKQKVAGEYVAGTESLAQIAHRYGERRENIHRWAKQFYGELSSNEPISTIMTHSEQRELEALRKQNAELQKKLEYADIKAKAFEIMIDIAEKQFGIDIKKKPGAKQP